MICQEGSVASIKMKRTTNGCHMHFSNKEKIQNYMYIQYPIVDDKIPETTRIHTAFFKHVAKTNTILVQTITAVKGDKMYTQK